MTQPMFCSTCNAPLSVWDVEMGESYCPECRSKDEWAEEMPEKEDDDADPK